MIKGFVVGASAYVDLWVRKSQHAAPFKYNATGHVIDEIKSDLTANHGHIPSLYSYIGLLFR